MKRSSPRDATTPLAGTSSAPRVAPVANRGAPRGSAARIRGLVAGDLVLEPQVVGHADEMYAVLNDPALYAFEDAPPASREWLRMRFAKLETRTSADGSEQWLNWVIRLPSGEAIGYVQATVRTDGSAAIAYVLGSAYWGRGLARRATTAMIDELVGRYGVGKLVAVASRRNLRSIRLLKRLGFAPAPPALQVEGGIPPEEVLMLRAARTGPGPAA